MGCGIVKVQKNAADISSHTSLSGAPRDFTQKVRKGAKHINWCPNENEMIDPMSLSSINP